MSDAGNSVSDIQYYGYCLVDFDSFVDFRTIEFLEQLPDAHVCDYCGAVPGKVLLLPCMHVSCNRCCTSEWNSYTRTYQITCAIDKRVFREHNEHRDVKQVLYTRRVRCPNASYGCNYTCALQELATHFPNCQYFWTICSLCGTRIPYMKLPDHYAACRSLVPSVASAFAKNKQLLEDLNNAKKEFEEVVGKPSDEGALRQKVDSVLEVLERLRIQFADA